MFAIAFIPGVTAGVLLAPPLAPPPPPPAPPAPCRAILDLEHEAGEGSSADRSGALLRWSAGAGATLTLHLVAPGPGTFEIALYAARGPEAPPIRAKLWHDALTSGGQPDVRHDRAGSGERLTVRFDAIALTPGRHVLELSALEPGEILLDCLELRRTGDWEPPGRERVPGIAYLGVELGDGTPAGVPVTGIVAGSGAEEAGLAAGDVIQRIGAEKVTSSSAVRAAIRRHRPGDRLALAVVRDGATIEVVASLGRRIDTQEAKDRAEHVLGVLDLRPGQTIADLGCGTGWLSEAIASRVGPAGRVYAVEIIEAHIRDLRRSASPNVLPVYSVPDDILLPTDSLDTAMLHDVASHVAQTARPKFYESVARALKPEGRLVILDPHGRARSMLDEVRRYGFVPENEEALAQISDENLDARLQEGIVFHFESP